MRKTLTLEEAQKQIIGVDWDALNLRAGDKVIIDNGPVCKKRGKPSQKQSRKRNRK